MLNAIRDMFRKPPPAPRAAARPRAVVYAGQRVTVTAGGAGWTWGDRTWGTPAEVFDAIDYAAI